jgi:hypothetical protein
VVARAWEKADWERLARGTEFWLGRTSQWAARLCRVVPRDYNTAYTQEKWVRHRLEGKCYYYTK